MFMPAHPRREFADTQFAGAETTWSTSMLSQTDGVDAADRMRQAEAADRSLLRLVVCVSLATLALALASALRG